LRAARPPVRRAPPLRGKLLRRSRVREETVGVEPHVDALVAPVKCAAAVVPVEDRVDLVDVRVTLEHELDGTVGIDEERSPSKYAMLARGRVRRPLMRIGSPDELKKNFPCRNHPSIAATSGAALRADAAT